MPPGRLGPTSQPHRGARASHDRRAHLRDRHRRHLHRLRGDGRATGASSPPRRRRRRATSPRACSTRSAIAGEQARPHHRGAARAAPRGWPSAPPSAPTRCCSAAAPRSGSSPPGAIATSSTSCAGARGVPGLASEKVLHFPESNKPDPPIVPKTCIAEVSERVDCKGQVVVELNEDEAEAAIRRLVAKGVEAIAICFLWSFKTARARAAREGDGRAARAGRLRLLLGRPRAALGRVRADGGHGHQRLPGPGDGALHGARRPPRRRQAGLR